MPDGRKSRQQTIPAGPAPIDAVHGLEALTSAHGRLFLVVGVFDGLHRGHHYLLRHLRREAARRGARPAVVTFDAHPDEIVLGAAPPLLCDLDERLVRLTDAGVQVIVVQHFDVALRMTPFDRFVEMLRARTEIAGFLMTPDAAFGHERRGTPEAVAALGQREGFEVVVVPPLDLDGQAVRSSEVRVAVAAGDLARVRHLLGRSLAVVGEHSASGVNQREAHLGFPIPMALPPIGEYEVTVERAWPPDRGIPPRSSREVIRAIAEVNGDRLLVRALRRSRRDLPEAPRLRVTFRAQLG